MKPIQLAGAVGAYVIAGKINPFRGAMDRDAGAGFMGAITGAPDGGSMSAGALAEGLFPVLCAVAAYKVLA